MTLFVTTSSTSHWIATFSTLARRLIQRPKKILFTTMTTSRPPQLVEEKIVYQQYFSIYRRKVNFVDGQQYTFDVVGHPHSNFCGAMVFPFDKQKKTVTLVREYQ